MDKTLYNISRGRVGWIKSIDLINIDLIDLIDRFFRVEKIHRFNQTKEVHKFSLILSHN